VESEFLSNISDLESQEHMSSPSATYPLGPVLPHEHHVLSNWLSSQGVSQEYSPQHHSQYLSTSAALSSHLPPNYILLPFNKSISQGVLRFISSSELRKKVYAVMTAQPAVNISLLCRLILIRHKLSVLMGFQSYNERILSRKVIKNSSIVLLMLEKLSQATNQQTSKEIKSLEELKERYHSSSPSSAAPSSAAPSSAPPPTAAVASAPPSSAPPSSTSVASTSVDKKVYPWDVNYLGDLYGQTQLKHHGSNSTHSHSHDQVLKEFSQYCHMETCLKGLELICYSIFGITMKREKQMNPSEIWTENPEDLIKYTLYHTNGEREGEREGEGEGERGGDQMISTPLGTIYLDPYTRDHKFGGASHFTIRCGCSNALSSFEELSGTASEAPTGTGATARAGAGYQLPIVALVFSFQKNSKNGNGIFLSPMQFENLYHEWGHALHSLLSRTKFQHLSGTRGSTDFVEV
jgi:mitochondrial intermediate peptidase